ARVEDFGFPRATRIRRPVGKADRPVDAGPFMMCLGDDLPASLRAEDVVVERIGINELVLVHGVGVADLRVRRQGATGGSELAGAGTAGPDVGQGPRPARS